jgi:flagellar basal-body rod modification protein FlgD
MAVSSVSSGSTVSQTLLDTMNPQSTSSSGTSAEDIQNRFMTMLVAQMKNQDPLNPLDNSQVTSQMAQLSTVSGIEGLNTTMKTLMGSYQASQNLQASSMIGHGILAAGNKTTLSGGVAGMGVNLASAADHVVVDVYDASGVKVNSIELNDVGAGVNSFSWDGSIGDGKTAPDGTYTFKVSATNNGKTVDVSTLQFGVVGSVSFGTSGSVVLGVPGMGDVNFGDVKQVL